jgi:colanic acid/amylovoran biosynthesis glycosyltransferase
VDYQSGGRVKKPRVLQLFNVFGALTERAMSDYTLALCEQGFESIIGYEQLQDASLVSGMEHVHLQRINVASTGNVAGQMENIAGEVHDPAMNKLLADGGIDLVHGHFGPRLLQGAAWLRRGLPIVISTYGYDVGRLLKDECWIDRYRWAAEHGATFVALARFMEEKLLGFGLPRERVRRIHLGIEIAKHSFTPAPAPSSPRFVFIGRFVDKKGAEVLLEAMAHLKRAMKTTVTLDLIGGGPNEAQLREQAKKLDIEAIVNFVGLVPFTKLFDYLDGCTAMVQPSVTAADGDAEGAPMVLMTAQASGVPCVTTWHSGNPETIPPEGLGFVVPERDAVALAESMMRMIELKAADRMALQKAGRAWIELHFNLDHTVWQYASLYRQLIDRGRGVFGF